MRALSFSEKRDWLQLTRTQNVGPVAFRDLLHRYGSAGKALDALPDLIRSRKITAPSRSNIEAEMEQSEAKEIALLASCEPEYPKYLRALDPPPPLISVWGRVPLLHQPCLAVIGSRNASAIGQRFARQISAELGEAGYIIVSGLALGIDTNAHHAAIATGTIGVLGGGVDHIYPRQNTELYEIMRERGALVSESPLGYKATARDFPRRNRIISGLSRGVIVIEAAERSGTLITARYALEQNREVMAAPGSPLDPRTKGCNRLIRQGATLIENAQDVIDAISTGFQPSVEEPDESYRSPAFDWAQAETEITQAKDILLNLLSPSPTSRDELIRASHVPYPIASAALLELELNAEIDIEPNGYISRLM